MIRILLYIFIITGLYADELDYNYIEDEVKQTQLKNNKNPPPCAIHIRRIVE